MRKQARQRTAAQRRANSEDDILNDNNVIQDEQEQEAEIASLRQRNAADDKKAQFTLDIGVLGCFCLSGIQLLINFRSYSAFLIVLGLIQTNLLPLSLTPHWLPLFEPVTIGRHHIIVIVHFLIFIVVFVVLQDQDAGIVEIARWSLPCLMAGVVEMTRRGERDAERKLERLEGLTYAMKGP